MAKPKKPKDFIQTPRYEGGDVALRKYLDENLRYPQEALDHRIEGAVEAEYFVNGLGNITKVKILKGIGYGCDEEVIRLVKSLVYQKAVNRGLKTLTRKTVRINFKLPEEPKTTLNYQLVKNDTPDQSTGKQKENTYNITINLSE